MALTPVTSSITPTLMGVPVGGAAVGPAAATGAAEGEAAAAAALLGEAETLGWAAAGALLGAAVVGGAAAGALVGTADGLEQAASSQASAPRVSAARARGNVEMMRGERKDIPGKCTQSGGRDRDARQCAVHPCGRASPMQHKIVGTTMPVLELTLDPGESIVAEAGELGWIGSSIDLRTTTAAAGSQGIFGALRRAVGGGGLFMTEYRANGAPGLVAFATKVPGHILPVEVQPGQAFMVHRHGFLCGTPAIELSVGFQRSLGAGVFGGQGFVLQKIAGQGQAWIELDGEVVQYDLAAGETLRVHPGHVGMFEAGVNFDITMLRGIRNVLFGGDGLFLAALTGPGRVWLQSLPLSNLAHALEPYLPRESSGNTAQNAAAGGIAGAVLGGLFGGNQQDQ